MTDIFDSHLVTVNTSEGAAYSAELLAATGTGYYPDVARACNETIRITGCASPSQSTEAYNSLYPVYRSLYPKWANIEFMAYALVKWYFFV